MATDKTEVHGQEASKDEGLFPEFSAATYEEWKKEAESGLKGAPFEKKLFTSTYEGITLKPIYQSADTGELAQRNDRPGVAPYLRGTEPTGYLEKPWDVCQEIAVGTPEEWNATVRHDLTRGQTAVAVVPDRPTRLGIDPENAQPGDVARCGLSLSTVADGVTAFEAIDLPEIPLLMYAGATAVPVTALMSAMLAKKGQLPSLLNGCIGADPLGELAMEGFLPVPIDTAYEHMAQLAAWAEKNAPRLRTVLVRGEIWQNAGGSAVQELAFALAAGAEYLRNLTAQGIGVDGAAAAMRFSFSVGSSFFMEIAKLRAARLLWSNIVEAFGGSEAARKMVVHARTSSYTKTVYDPYVNMIRDTAEAFAGVMGGVQSLHVSPFDETVRPADNFSRRVARNLQIMLQQECHFTVPVDPAGGSWYVESLTDQVAEKAWDLFREVEAKGGLRKALEEGFPQQGVGAVAKKKRESVETRRDVIVGTNMYPNLTEKPLEQPIVDQLSIAAGRADEVKAYRRKADGPEVEKAFEALTGGAGVMRAAIAAFGAGATMGELVERLRKEGSDRPKVTPIRMHRKGEPFERLRRNAEAYAAETGSRMKVFPVNMGPIPQHKPRADFSTGFFEAGGFEMLKNDGFATVEAAVNAVVASRAPIAVICSTDQTYPDLVPPLVKGIKSARPETIVILAGKPAPEHEQPYKEAGLDDAIHIRSNVYEVLAGLQKKGGFFHD